MRYRVEVIGPGALTFVNYCPYPDTAAAAALKTRVERPMRLVRAARLP